MKTIAILSANSPASITFMLELAKLGSISDKKIGLVPGKLIKSTLTQYAYDNVHYSNIDLFDEHHQAEGMDYCIYQGYLPNADYSILLLEHNLYNIKHMVEITKTLSFDNTFAVLLNALDIKYDIDYILSFHFAEASIPIFDRYVVPFDEHDITQQFDAQVEGEMDLSKCSKDKKKMLLDLGQRLYDFSENDIKQLKKQLRKRLI